MTADVQLIFSEDINDKDLPLVKFIHPSGRVGLARRRGAPLPGFDVWPLEVIEGFLNHQFEVIVPYFPISTTQAPHYALEEGAVLPWVEFDSGTSPSSQTNGAFGAVTKVKIHPAHHGSHTGSVGFLSALRRTD